MAPPIALSNVAGSLALSFTAGRAAPASEPPPIQTPTSVPAPPTAPPTSGETPEPPTTATTTPEPAPTTTTPAPTPPPEPAPTTESPFIGPVEPAAEEEVEVPTPVVTAPRLFRPNTRKLMFSLFVGGSKALRGGYSYFGSEFKAEGAFGGFDDRFRVGGFAVVQVNAGFPLNSFTFAPRLALNRQIVPGYAFYFNTNVTLGYRLTTYNSQYFGGYYYDGYGYDYDEPSNIAYHSAVLGVSWGASAIIAERLQLSFRPLDLELVAPAPGLVQINWAAMGGIGVLLGKTTHEKR